MLFSSESCKPPTKSVKLLKWDINVRSENTYKIHASVKAEPPSASAIAVYHLESSQLLTVIYANKVMFPVSKDYTVDIKILNHHEVFFSIWSYMTTPTVCFCFVCVLLIAHNTNTPSCWLHSVDLGLHMSGEQHFLHFVIYPSEFFKLFFNTIYIVFAGDLRPAILIDSSVTCHFQKKNLIILVAFNRLSLAVFSL